jgi:hypothetical protein
MNLLSKTIQENFIIVYISTGLTMNEYHNPIIVSRIEASTPDYWELLTPSAYIAYYRSKKSDSNIKAEKLIKDIQELILTDDKFEYFKVGRNEGMIVTELDWRGRITSHPIGLAVSQAAKNQKGKQEIAQQTFPADAE